MSGETERDTYELDTTLAEKNLQAIYDSLLRVEAGLNGSAEAAGEMEGQSKSMAAAVFAGNLAFEAASKAAHMLWESLKGGVEAAAAETRALEQLRVVAGESTEALHEQAEVMEHTFGVASESVMGAQAALLRFGLSVNQIEPVTRAIHQYANATGKDLVEATREVTRAVENGGGKLESLGLQFQTTGRAAHDLTSAAEAISAKFGGSAEADAATVAGRAKLAAVAFEDLRKSFGNVALAFEAKHGILDDLRLALEGLNLAMFGDPNSERNERLAAVMDANVIAADELLRLRRMLVEVEKNGSIDEEKRVRFMVEQQRARVAELTLELDVLRGINTEKSKPEPAKDRETKAGIAAREQAEKESDERRTKLVNAFLANEKVVEAKRTELFKQGLEIREREFEAAEARKNFVTDHAITERERRERRAMSRMSTAIATEATKAGASALLAFEPGEGSGLTERIQNALVRAVRGVSGRAVGEAYAAAVVGPLLEAVKSASGQLLDVLVANPLREFLTTNQTFNAEFMQASIERRQAELAEQGIIKTTAELRREAEQEAANEQKRRLAETLANIAIEAGKQSLFQVAEGIGNLAAQNYAAAGLNFAAAAAYGLVAGAAGGAAFAITQSRGRTTGEREALEAQREAARKARESKQGAQTGSTKGDTVVNVYQLGITGQTRTAQARELARIGAEYEGLVRLGGGGP